MAITKFKITRKPVRADLKLAGGLLPLNQEYHISQQATMTVDVFDRGVPYDNFGFKLGNDNGDWSPEYQCTINALVSVSTPEITPNNLFVATGGQRNLAGDIVWNTSTDRIKVVSISGDGFLVVNGSRAIIGQTYFVYEFINLIFVSTASIETQNVVTTITLLPSNDSGDGVNADIVITTTGNLRAVINDLETTDELVTGTLTNRLGLNPSISGQTSGVSIVIGTLTVV